MTWRDCHGICHRVISQVLSSGGVTFQKEKHPQAVQAWMQCSDATWAPFDVTNKPVDCMTCLVKGAL